MKLINLSLIMLCFVGCTKQVAQYQINVEEEKQAIQQEKPNRATSDIRTFYVSLDMYKADNGDYPTTEQGLKALISEPKEKPLPRHWKGPYLKDKIPVDPWGHEYLYYYDPSQDTNYILKSDGPTKQPDDDILDR